MIQLSLSLCAAAALAADPTLVIHNGRVFDPNTMQLHAAADLWIAGTRVLGEKPLGTATHSSARVIDAQGAALVPGLFDLHVHIAVPGSGMDTLVNVAPEDELRSHLACGVTNVLDLHADQSTIFALRDQSRTAKDLARFYAVGAAFTVPGGHGTQFGIEANAVTTTDEVDRRFDALLAKKPDAIKAILEHGEWGVVPKMPTLDAKLFGAIGARAKAAHLPLFTHIWTTDEALTAANGGAAALAHGVFVGDVTPELLEAMKRNSVAYVPTLSVVIGAMRAANDRSPYANELARAALHPDVYASVASGHGLSWASSAEFGGGEKAWFANLKKVADAGLELGTGTDAGNPLTPHGAALIEELALYVEAGLTPARALRAATLGSAKILRVDRDLGSLDAGKLADVVVVDGDPTNSIAAMWHVRSVLKAGELVDRDAIFALNAAKRRATSKKQVGSEWPARIDDFDREGAQSAWGAAWQVVSDSVAGGHSSAKLSVKDGALHLAGTLAQGFPYGPFAGAVLQFDPDKKVLADASNFDGVRLRVRGTERYYNLTLHRAAVKDFNVFSSTLDVTPEWKEITLPFSKFRQIGFGAAVPWAANDFTALEIDARVPYGTNEVGDFELEIDWIELYRKG